MKPDVPKAAEVQQVDGLISDAASLGVTIDVHGAELMMKHLHRALEENLRLNLTAVTEWDRALRLHVLDSLGAIPYLPSGVAKTADLGSGAGFPGIPIAIVTRTRVALVESIRKKAAFLESVVSELGIGQVAAVRCGRAEELALTDAGAYECVTARALSSLPALVELASPLLAIGGSLIAMKGRPDEAELDAGVRAGTLVGMTEEGRYHYVLPGAGEQRTIVRYSKVAEPELSLPRRPGLAQKRPLA